MNNHDQKLREKQMAEAEEVLGDALAKAGFAKGLYFGRYQGEKLAPYPDLDADPAVNQMAAELAEFCRQHVDPVAIDRAVWWVLGRPGIFLNTVGDIDVLPLVLDAAARFEARPSDAQMQEIAQRQAMEPLFA